ncbi:uncharacterized protein EDB91DRAFT_1257155 [Suillus paluster]|uniref:uncharacterized protein n=1 Tax=Suillus paluster TaxID=48578 RepID=UPI001B86BAB0|nr:uncharacterized protein EDB91DRAFT_1257155 [Suillus paluster]KAG1720130.1 hypothetical protein EDB91DRAFT_1257155 [Suillus paluster]
MTVLNFTIASTFDLVVSKAVKIFVTWGEIAAMTWDDSIFKRSATSWAEREVERESINCWMDGAASGLVLMPSSNIRATALSPSMAVQGIPVYWVIWRIVKVVLKGEVTQRASASARALCPLPEYVPLISGGQRGSPTEVRGVPEDKHQWSSVELRKTMWGQSKATMEIRSRNRTEVRLP